MNNNKNEEESLGMTGNFSNLNIFFMFSGKIHLSIEFTTAMLLYIGK